MAADGGALKRLFEKPLPENPTLLEALSAWNHTHHKKLVDSASFTEIFGELHFQEKQHDHVAAAVRAARPSPPPPPPPPLPRRTVSWLDVTDAVAADKSKDDSSLDALLKAPASGGATFKRSASFCLKSSRSLLLCTEGLGSESTVDADDMVKDGDNADVVETSVHGVNEMDVDTSDAVADDTAGEGKEQRAPPSFPPPIRSIGRGGKPCVCFRSVRAEGRFLLLEVVIPGKDLLQATREGGRLRLRFAAAAAAVGAGAVDEEMHGEETAACIGRDTFA
ncbi:protein FAF-like, chloroplastic [Oryza brachyantha]|uniref:protein FAF-like, chloroplastic n=1 Tax=Oryza brachyantha TaxID=4533 RepID=UPI001ADC2E90|nr:protein FAF-like, chloroplastic [Oryza brachyantha]